ncbi:DsbA family oxidoreductase [Novosphingobium sp. ST904]|uniref:DsbA family oxidoreductase n=1 Tax=Novosphingobium sp. ST904 TaxID=1684385 RepID=UPI0006C87BFC|nr:DsbA family oxidoreductase [Novosphingobium sp. ST904]KPH62108.1 hypothetical protein ADT71_16120 [Novosphingobium sp. ST904]TCM33188.1 putative DsbA family dithiol-disulfide isomerase [Novosphingobium sp. ST904]
MSALIVEIWSDVVCPWCWIGLTRFEKALERFAHHAQVETKHHSYRLMPGQPPLPVAEMVRRKMGGGPAEAARMFAHVEATAAADGLTYHLADSVTGDTLDAHRLIKLGSSEGLGIAMLKRLYRAYLTEQMSVFDHDILLHLAAETGLDPARAQKVLNGDEFHAEIEADQRALNALGGNGVPFFLIGGKYAISGAQPVAAFAQALDRAWAERPLQPLIVAEGPVCGLDGCP